MKNLKKILLRAIFTISVLGFATYAIASSLPLGGQTYYLAGSGVNSTQNTIQLTYFLTPDGTPITMSEFGTTGYGVLEPQTTSRIEDISFTGITQNSNGTATLTGVTRGVQFNFPYASLPALEKSHAGGAQFIISNTAEFYYNEFAMPNNSNVFTAPTTPTSVATKGYVDGIAFSGAGAIAATTAAQGYVQIGTPVQVASSTQFGSTGATLVVPASDATSTFNAATAPLKVVVTNNAGTIDPNFLNLGSYTGPTFPLASSTLIGYQTAFTIGKNTFATSTSGTWTVPNGVTIVWVRIVGGGGSGGASQSGSSGGSGGYVEGPLAVSGSLSFTIGAGGSGVGQPSAGSPGFSTVVGGMTAGGGNGGGFCNGSAGAGGGAGGTASGGTFNSVGNSGQFCVDATSNVINGTTTPSMLGSSAGAGSAGASNTSLAGKPGEMILNW